MPAEDTLVDTRPMMSAKKPLATSQPARLPRSLRSASAVGEDSPVDRGGALSRRERRPLPMSRRAAIAPATAIASAAAASGSSRTAGRAPVKGRSSSLQPSGVAQRSHPSPDEVSATTRTTSASVTAALPSSSATRREGASWLASAPTPVKTGATTTIASARYADPPAGSLAATRPRNRASHSSAAPAAIALIAERYACRRETTPASTSSWRPVSSSARSARTAASMPQTAATIERKPPTRQAV